MTIHQSKASFLAIPFILILTIIPITALSSNIFAADKAELEKHGEEVLQNAQPSIEPAFMKEHYGNRGENYHMTDDGKPYILCDSYNKVTCKSDNIDDCTETVKCESERSTHQLGCMAVYIYNSTKDAHNFSENPHDPALKGCWNQEAAELRECHTHEKCIVELELGTTDGTPHFCCCRTHNCNKVVTFQELANVSTEEPPEVRDRSDETTTEKPSGFSFDYTSVLGVMSLIAITCLLVSVFIIKRQKKKRVIHEVPVEFHITPVASSNIIPMKRLDYNAQCMAVINGKLCDLRNVELKEVTKISRGRFGEVYRGEIEGAYLAVKLCGRAELDSWVNEQDIYTIRPMRKHDNIAEFVASFEYNNRYWLVTQYYCFGSLFDYLQTHTVSLSECAMIIAGFLNGLAFLHEDRVTPFPKPTIIHRDFKSKNVLMKDNLTSCISDFGLAMKYDGATMSDELHGQVGTRRYMAPEVLEGATEFTSFAFQQIDVYAAALVMWEVLNRTEVPTSADSEYPPAKLPYEAEVGLSPTLGPLRELIVLKKARPKIRDCILTNSSAEKLVSTMTEMWEMEPDARITSGCARDRVVRVHFEICGTPYKTEMDHNEVIPDIPVIPLPQRIIRSDNRLELREEFVANTDGDVETAFLGRRQLNES